MDFRLRLMDKDNTMNPQLRNYYLFLAVVIIDRQRFAVAIFTRNQISIAFE